MLGSVFLVLVIFAVLVVSHLIVSSKVVAIGRELQTAKNEIDRLEYINVNYAHEIAQKTRLEVMEEKAKEMGFRPPYPGESFYIVVPGLGDERTVSVSREGSAMGVDVDVYSPAYHQTLFDWIHDQLALFFLPSGDL